MFESDFCKTNCERHMIITFQLLYLDITISTTIFLSLALMSVSQFIPKHNLIKILLIYNEANEKKNSLYSACKLPLRHSNVIFCNDTCNKRITWLYAKHNTLKWQGIKNRMKVCNVFAITTF